MSDPTDLLHLYRRLGFGLSPKQWHQMKNLSLKQGVDQLFKGVRTAAAFEAPRYAQPSRKTFQSMDKTKRKEVQRELRRGVSTLNQTWVRHMISDESSPLLEKMTLFWHGHFACGHKRVDFAAQQLQTLRQHALGNFRDLLVAISKDAAMILYLNNQQNRKSKPNENFARELMELFTLGRGHYSEQDVKEAARAFTGWFTNRFTGVFQWNERQHDPGSKTFMGKTGRWKGEDIIDFILEKKQTARFLTTKIYRYFVNENEVDEVRINRLADLFYRSNYNIGQLMRAIAESAWFYEQKGTKIKSPIEWLVGTSKILQVQYETAQSVILPQRALGQILFQPPNVAGWEGGRAWIDNATLLLRLNFVPYLFRKTELNVELNKQPERNTAGKFNKLPITADPKPLANAFRKPVGEALEQALGTYLLAVPPQKSPSLDRWVQQSRADERVVYQAMRYMSLPEYQLC